jgi:hypothetical protein
MAELLGARLNHALYSSEVNIDGFVAILDLKSENKNKPQSVTAHKTPHTTPSRTSITTYSWQ